MFFSSFKYEYTVVAAVIPALLFGIRIVSDICQKIISAGRIFGQDLRDRGCTLLANVRREFSIVVRT